jgi:TP901 family phage tail tape measure protein
MATVLEKTIEIIFQGDDRSSAAIGSVIGSMNKLEGAVTAVTNPLAEMANMVLKTEAALMALSAGALVYSISEYANFEDIMLKVKGVLGANAEEYQQLTELTRELGSTTRYTAVEAAQGLEFLALAGFTIDEAIGALPSVLQLAQASALDLGRAADIVTNIMAGYGIEVEGLVDANDVLTATFTNSNTSLDQLGAAFKFVGPVAKAMGLELDETASILGILANAGYQAEMGGTALRNILIALVEPSSNMSKMFEKLGVDTTEFGIDVGSAQSALASLGVTVKDSEGNIRPFADIMDDLKVGLEAIPDPADRAAILIEIFGKRGGPQMAALLEQGSGAVRGLEDKIQSLGGVTAEIAEEMESGMGGALRVVKSAMNDMVLAIGAAVSGDLATETKKVATLFNAIADEVDKGTFQPIIDAIVDVAREFADYSVAIADALPEALEGVKFENFTKSMDNLIETVKELFKAVFPEDLTTADGLEKAIQKIVNAITFLTNTTSKILTAWQPFFEALGKVITDIGDADSEIYKFANRLADLVGPGQVIDMMIDKFGLLGGTAIGAVINGLSLASKEGGVFSGSMGEGAAAVAELEEGIGGKLLRAFQNYGVGVADASAKTDELGNTISGFPEGIQIDFSAPGMLELQGALAAFGLDLNDIPREKIVELAAITDPVELHNAIAALADIPELKNVSVQTTADAGSLDNTVNTINTAVPEKKDTKVYSATDPGSLNTVQGQLDILAAKRIMEVEARADQYALEQMKAQFELMQTAVEWKAKLDIAEVEANAKKVEGGILSPRIGLYVIGGNHIFRARRFGW